jgi:hypothetical protein
MKVVSVTAAAVSIAGLVAAGCVHEQLPRPTAGDIARINQAADENHWLRVEYVEPIASTAGVHVVKPIGIESIDADHVVFRTQAGEMRLVPSDMVRGVTVKQRLGGIAGGASLGLAGGALVAFTFYLLASIGSGGGFPDSGERTPCDDPCVARGVAPLVLIPAVAGAIAGYFVGARQTFDFGSHPGPSR